MGDLGKVIVATGFEWLPKVQKIAQSGHTDPDTPFFAPSRYLHFCYFAAHRCDASSLTQNLDERCSSWLLGSILQNCLPLYKGPERYHLFYFKWANSELLSKIFVLFQIILLKKLLSITQAPNY